MNRKGERLKAAVAAIIAEDIVERHSNKGLMDQRNNFNKCIH